jgi:hypothetical protein
MAVYSYLEGQQIRLINMSYVMQNGSETFRKAFIEGDNSCR